MAPNWLAAFNLALELSKLVIRDDALPLSSMGAPSSLLVARRGGMLPGYIGKGPPSKGPDGILLGNQPGLTVHHFSRCSHTVRQHDPGAAGCIQMADQAVRDMRIDAIEVVA